MSGQLDPMSREAFWVNRELQIESGGTLTLRPRAVKANANSLLHFWQQAECGEKGFEVQTEAIADGLARSIASFTPDCTARLQRVACTCAFLA